MSWPDHVSRANGHRVLGLLAAWLAALPSQLPAQQNGNVRGYDLGTVRQRQQQAARSENTPGYNELFGMGSPRRGYHVVPHAPRTGQGDALRFHRALTTQQFTPLELARIRQAQQGLATGLPEWLVPPRRAVQTLVYQRRAAEDGRSLFNRPESAATRRPVRTETGQREMWIRPPRGPVTSRTSRDLPFRNAPLPEMDSGSQDRWFREPNPNSRSRRFQQDRRR
jgi:hypothetical protein